VDALTTYPDDPNAALIIGTSVADNIFADDPGGFVYGAGGSDAIFFDANGGVSLDLNAPGEGSDNAFSFESGVDHLLIDMNAFGLSTGGWQFISGPDAHPTSIAPTFVNDTASDFLEYYARGTATPSPVMLGWDFIGLQASDLVPAQVSFANGANVVNTSPGSTTYGEGQNETLWATAGNETLQGGAYRGQYIAQAAGDTVVAGNAGSFIAALGGGDLLKAGAGADTFYFNSPSAGVDTIIGFNDTNGDNLTIQGSAFAAPAAFQFTDGVGFVQGPGASASAQTATFAYDTSTSYLWYDPDGTGAAAKSLVAFLPGSPTLHASDIHVV
jgi:hypothetical protein